MKITQLTVYLLRNYYFYILKEVFLWKDRYFVMVYVSM